MQRSFGRYEILDQIGAGGMGEVYRARDTQLNREVAVKILPAPLATDTAALARFEREARAVAALSHPHILAIHDFGTSDGIAFAVTELLEGETLASRLAHGPLPVRKAIEIGTQVASGLAAAHARDIVHRDLKPANLFITKDGQVKILDFGLAKQSGPAPAGADATQPLTDRGSILGTPGYMSPEQVRGETGDHRSDLFSFGVVLYEMLAGERPFKGDTAVEIMSAVLRQDPPDTLTQSASIPPGLARVVNRCLEKRPEERFQSAQDLGFALDNSSSTSIRAGAVLEAPLRRVRRWLLPVVGVAIGLAGGMTLRGSPPKTESQAVKVSPVTFSGNDWSPTASPDGRMLAFTSDRDGIPRIWLKQLHGGGEEALTEGDDDLPRFSRDGNNLLFVRDEGEQLSIYRIALVGGHARKLVHDSYSADWSPDGARIAFLRGGRDSESVVTLVGIADVRTGDERTIATLADQFVYGIRWSPDGSTLVATQGSYTGNIAGLQKLRFIAAETGEIWTAAPDSSIGPISTASWLSQNDLLLCQSSNLLGSLSNPADHVLRFHVPSRKFETLFWVRDQFPAIGGQVPVVEPLASGSVLYDEFSIRQNLHLGTIDGTGSGSMLTRGRSRDRQPAFSPDGTQIIFSSNRSGQLDLWTMTLATGEVRPVTDDAAADWDPAFTPDGRSILWSSDRSGHLEIWMANADGSGARRVSDDGLDAENPTMTRDGDWVVYFTSNPQKMGLWKIHPDGSGASQLIAAPGNIPDVSPDGRYAAFIWFETGLQLGEIRFVEIASGRPLSGGFDVAVRLRTGLVWGRCRWLPDGRALAFIAQDEAGVSGVYQQDFIPGVDTRATRRKIAGFSPDYVTESLAISPDGTKIVISRMEEIRSIMLAERR
jgi:serine/threonine protein kinase